MAKKMYLTDLLGDEFRTWAGKKIFICAPTGLGKTTFVIERLLPYLRERKKKLLILCNRKMLRMQYWNDVTKKYDSYKELEESVSIWTYQQLAEMIIASDDISKIFKGYETIVCDEAHFFYSDSDFNAFGTYALLQAIVYAGITKEMIFMTATANEVFPLIKTTVQNCGEKVRREKEGWDSYKNCGELLIKDYSVFADYERFKCIYLPDVNTLYWRLVTSSKKSIIFIDDIEAGDTMAKELCETGKITMQEIGILNADNLNQDGNSELVRMLAYCHRVLPKILITTAVLDNGISIHDPEVGNVVIMTESKVSFLQMLGRIRTELVDSCNLYFIPRKENIYRQRMRRYEMDCELFKKLEKDITIKNNPYYYLALVLESPEDEKTVFYRKAIVVAKHQYQFFVLPKSRVHCVRGDFGLYINYFARQKIGDMYIAESKFYSLALVNPIEVVYEQMSWIGKGREELRIEVSEYRQQRKKAFLEFMVSVQGFNQEKLQEFKQELVREYRKEFFPEILAKNGTLSSEKLQQICELYDLKYVSEVDSESRKKTYYIQMTDAMEEMDIE